jgi:hypothetical protein
MKGHTIGPIDVVFSHEVVIVSSYLSRIAFNNPLNSSSRLGRARGAIGEGGESRQKGDSWQPLPQLSALKGADHELEVQPVVLQIAPWRLDMLEWYTPVKLEL